MCSGLLWIEDVVLTFTVRFDPDSVKLESFIASAFMKRFTTVNQFFLSNPLYRVVCTNSSFPRTVCLSVLHTDNSGH